jgi:hypothetical protein
VTRVIVVGTTTNPAGENVGVRYRRRLRPLMRRVESRCQLTHWGWASLLVRTPAIPRLEAARSTEPNTEET